MEYDIRRTHEVIQRLCIKARVCRARCFVLMKRKKNYVGQQKYIRQAENFASRCEMQARYMARMLGAGAPDMRVRPSDMELDLAWSILVTGGQKAFDSWREQLEYGQHGPTKPNVYQQTLI